MRTVESTSATVFDPSEYPLLRTCPYGNVMPLRNLEAASVRWHQYGQPDGSAETQYLGALVRCEQWLDSSADQIWEKLAEEPEVAVLAEIVGLRQFLAAATQQVVNFAWVP